MLIGVTYEQLEGPLPLKVLSHICTIKTEISTLRLTSLGSAIHMDRC